MRSVIETAEAVRRGGLKASEVLDECLARIQAGAPKLNAFVHVDPEGAALAASAVDAAVADGRDPGPLAGVPFGVKDLEDCAVMPTSLGSLLFKGRPAVEADSLHVARLRAAGAVPLGKTAAPEFGTTCYTSTKAWGTTRNPWDPEMTPGGSSGGSAAGVVSGMVPFCTASDGGGSTRIPAAFSGLLGHKASYGRIAHENAALSQTSVVGALTTTVADAARHLDVAAGPDDRDRASLPVPTVRYEEAIESLDVRGLRVTWSLDLGFAVVDSEVADFCHAAAHALVDAAGLKLVERPFAVDNAMRTWLSAGAVDPWLDLEPGMWPERAADFTGLVRAGLERSEQWTVPRYARALRHRRALEEAVADLV